MAVIAICWVSGQRVDCALWDVDLSAVTGDEGDFSSLACDLS
jgi:hypothetical protein